MVAMIAEYALGTTIGCSVQFTDPYGEATDPTVITFALRRPWDGPITEYTFEDGDEIKRVGLGLYTVEIDLDAWGDWYSDWFGDGALVAGVPGRIAVAPSPARGQG